jgi:hypothetical protein
MSLLRNKFLGLHGAEALMWVTRIYKTSIPCVLFLECTQSSQLRKRKQELEMTNVSSPCCNDKVTGKQNESK